MTTVAETRVPPEDIVHGTTLDVTTEQFPSLGLGALEGNEPVALLAHADDILFFQSSFEP